MFKSFKQSMTATQSPPMSSHHYESRSAGHRWNSWVNAMTHSLGLDGILRYLNSLPAFCFVKKHWFWLILLPMIALIVYRHYPKVHTKPSVSSEASLLSGLPLPVVTDIKEASVTPAEPDNTPATTTNKKTVTAATLTETNVFDYVQRFSTVAVKEMKRYGVPASVTLALALMQSTAGTSALAKVHNNHFGINCFDNVMTEGVTGHVDVQGKCYQAYQTSWAGYRANSLMLTTNRYADIKKKAGKDPLKWIAEIDKLGYANAKHPGETLRQIISRYNLAKYDNLPVKK